MPCKLRSGLFSSLASAQNFFWLWGFTKKCQSRLLETGKCAIAWIVLKKIPLIPRLSIARFDFRACHLPLDRLTGNQLEVQALAAAVRVSHYLRQFGIADDLSVRVHFLKPPSVDP
ncbi:MAG TPA: hypothetical protein VMJ12_02855 [Candidatus Acidoferrales bacterium]|nr:hypothetical protein [Candidatus Acidoferrales bacterium]